VSGTAEQRREGLPDRAEPDDCDVYLDLLGGVVHRHQA
jgi:hypothetical protein